MHLLKHSTLPALLALGTLGACGQRGPTPDTEGAQIAINVAPLTTPEVEDACYRLTVTNAAGEVVWTRAEICADRYGDAKSAITYIGPCDATPVNGAPQMNTVTLELEELWDAEGVIDRDSYKNPCRHLDNGNDDGFGPCEREVECFENEDARVTYNLTILRDARQGFFDIAVNFEDIFCSAKLDCQYPDPDRPIELLFKPDGTRGQTAVIGLACTGGAGNAVDTVLHYNAIEVKCNDGTDIALDPSIEPGNAYTATNPDPAPFDAVWQYATYRGTQNLTCDGPSCNALYWNVAIGFDVNAPACTITASATASQAGAMSDGYTPTNTTYPWIVFDAKLTGSNGGLVCTQNPLDASLGAQTTYTEYDDPKLFCHHYDGDAAGTVADPKCEAQEVGGAYSFMAVGRPGGNDTWIAAIDRGQVVGHYQDDPPFADLLAFSFDETDGFLDLGTLDGSWGSKAVAVSDGLVVGWAIGDDSLKRAATWLIKDGQVAAVPIPGLGGEESLAVGVDDGSVIGAAQDLSGDYKAFLYNPEWEDEPTWQIPTESTGDSYGRAISGKSFAGVVEDETTSQSRAFVMVDGVDYYELGEPGSDAWSTAISGERLIGQIANAVAETERAFTWTPDTGLELLPTLGGSYVYAKALHSGSVSRHSGPFAIVGGATLSGDLATRAFLFTPSQGMNALPGLGGTQAMAVGLNGSTIVGFATLPGDTDRHAVMWNAESGAVVDLHGYLPTGWSDSTVVGIDAFGNIAGNAKNASGAQRGFLLVPTPSN